MITCPWCGTNYESFQSNCRNCGGPLPIPKESGLLEEEILMPPPPPRPIAQNYAWRLLFSDGWAIAALVLLILGVIFAPLGIILTVVIVTAFVGLPFAALGLLFLAGGAAVVWWRYREMQQVVDVLRIGDSTTGQILSVEENYHVEINGRNPWLIRYQFQHEGLSYEGQVSTLNTPAANLQAGKPACILYLPQTPARNSLYPHP
jgi:membrane protein implicated in regulation of membrane protease activity